MKNLSLIAAASALVLAGCAQQPVSQPGTPEPVPVLSAEIAPGVTVHYDNELVARMVEVKDARINTSARLPKLTFRIHNLSSQRLPIEYQIEWRDADGAPLLVSNGWLQATLTGNTEKAVSSIGKSVDAKSAAVTVRVPNVTQYYSAEPDPVETMRMQQQYNQQLLNGANQ